MTEENAVPAVKVHITGSDVHLAHAKPKRPTYRTVFTTFVLTSTEPTQCILTPSDERVIAHIQTIDNDIVLASSQAQAGAKNNTQSSVPNPSGTLVPAKTTGGSAAVYPVMDNGQVWAGATTTGSNSRIAVSAVYRVE